MRSIIHVFSHGGLPEELRDDGWLLCDWLPLLRVESGVLSATTAL